MQSFRRKLRSLLGLVALSAVPVVSYAIPVSFNIDLTVTTVVTRGDCRLSSLRHNFGCLINANDHFGGSFTVDNSILAVDGPNLTAPISHFILQIGTVVWAQDFASDLVGFRNGLGFVNAPGFSIVGNTVDSLIGGVFGGADVPFVDFFADVRQFRAIDSIGDDVIGNMAISRIPEPATLALLGAGLLGLGVTRKTLKSSAATK